MSSWKVYLDVMFDDKQMWKAHVKAQVKKGRKALWSCNAFIGRNWGLSPKMTLWLICGCRMVGHKGHCLARSELQRLQGVACIMIIGAMRTISTSAGDVFGSATVGKMVESAALIAAYDLSRPNPKNLETGHTWFWAKADKVDSKCSMIKDQITSRRIFGKYQVVIPTWEEWEKN